MAGKRTIYLDNEAEILWDDMFHNSEKSASGWIKLKLSEEKGGSKDPFLLLKRLEEIKYQTQALEAEQKLIHGQLDTIKEATKKKVDNNIAYHLDQRKVIVQAQTIKNLWNIPENKSKEWAEEYLLIDAEERPELVNFIHEKLERVEAK